MGVFQQQTPRQWRNYFNSVSDIIKYSVTRGAHTHTHTCTHASAEPLMKETNFEYAAIMKKEWLRNFIFCWPCIKQWFLVNDQRDAQIPFYVFIFLFITLYIFRVHRAHHQERQIVSIQPLVNVTLCWWLCRLQVGVELTTCARHGHQHRVTFTRGCIDTICLSWWWARCARNM
jgi:hypothetical protein